MECKCGVLVFGLERRAGEDDSLSDDPPRLANLRPSQGYRIAPTPSRTTPADHNITTPMQGYVISPWNR